MTRKTLATLISAALVLSVFVAPAADAKKKKKKKPKPAACAPYVPGEQGAEAETIVLTDAATADKPVTYDFELEQKFDEGLTGDPTPAFVNVQVDSAAASAGLYATFAFPTRRDYDLYVHWSNGNEAASSHGFNPLAEAKTPGFDLSNTSNNHAGETTASSENIIGLTTPDCGGYTLRMLNYFGEGGAMQLKLWLGEGTIDPKPEAG